MYEVYRPQSILYNLIIRYDDCTYTSKDYVHLMQREVKDAPTRRDSLWAEKRRNQGGSLLLIQISFIF